MGFYFRKSARLGPFRINFSKSGVGLSAGIRGLRMGTGPRGAYIHAGVAGLYYRQSLGGSRHHSGSRSEGAPEATLRTRQPSPNIPSDDITLGREEIIDSGSVLQMTDSTGSGLLEALAECRDRTAYAPWVLAAASVPMAYALWTHSWYIGVLGLLLLPFAYWVRVKDVERKGFILQYDLDDGATKAATDLVEACERIGTVSNSWHKDSTREVLDAKYHAGAGAVVKRSATRLSIQDPPYLRTNIPVPAINMGRETIYFLPDRLLVYSGRDVGGVAYHDLQITVHDTQFVEPSRSSVPSDAEVIGSTWRYVNKKGGPDRRFKDNPELPVCRYEEIHLTSGSGLREVLQLSKRGLGTDLQNAIARLNDATANGKVVARDASPEEGAPTLRPHGDFAVSK